MGIGGISPVQRAVFASFPRGPNRATFAHVAQLEHLVATGDHAASGLLPTSGNRFHLAESTAAFADEVVADVRAARDHVNLTFYGFQQGAPGGPISEKVTAALVDRAGEIPVTVQMDQVGSGMLLRRGNELVDRLRDHGVDVTIHRLPGLLGRARGDAWRTVDHRKIVEIDGRVAWAGGMNAVDGWADWPDLMLRVEGPAAAQTGAVLAARGRALGGEVTARRVDVLRAGLSATAMDDATHATRILTDGNRNRRELSDAFVAATNAANERFVLTDPYLSDPRAMHAVIDAARRLGPRAELFLSPKATTGGQRQDVFTDPLRRAWAFRFKEAGGTVHVRPEFSHAKAWLADDVAGVGSHNKDRASMRMSYENLVASNAPDAVALLEASFARARDASIAATDDTVRGWRTLARLRDALGLQY